MKFSEAIRLGAMMKPQAFGTSFDGIGTCANGAARDAIGLLGNVNGDIGRLFPLGLKVMELCAVCGKLLSVPSVGGFIAHLNDDHEWTRERIADFVETMESQPADVAVGEAQE